MGNKSKFPAFISSSLDDIASATHGYGVTIIVALFFLLVGVIIGLVLIGLTYGNTDNATEWKTNNKKCGPETEDTCFVGEENDHGRCRTTDKGNGKPCVNACCVPEEECESENDNHWCQNDLDKNGKPCTTCRCTQPLGICEEDSDCPSLGETTVDFPNETNVGPFSFGKSVACENKRCVFKWDAARIPGFFNPVFGCSADFHFLSQCKGILPVGHPQANCLRWTAVCRSNAVDPTHTRTIDHIQDDGAMNVRNHFDQDTNLGVDLCIANYANAPAPGLLPISVLP